MFAPSRRRTFSDRAPERCSRVERFEPVTAALRLLSSPSSRLASSGGRAARPVPCRRPSLPPAPELRKSRETVSLRPSVFADTRYRRPGARHGKVGHRHPTEHQPRRAELAPNHRQRERLRVEPLYHVAPPNPHEPRPSATASPARRRAPELSQDVNVPTSSTSFLSEIQHAKPSARADGPIEHEVNDVPRLSVPRTSPVPPTKATSRIGRYLGSLRGAFQHDLAGRSANAAKSGRGARKGRGGDHGRGRGGDLLPLPCPIGATATAGVGSRAVCDHEALDPSARSSLPPRIVLACGCGYPLAACQDRRSARGCARWSRYVTRLRSRSERDGDQMRRSSRLRETGRTAGAFPEPEARRSPAHTCIAGERGSANCMQ